MNKSPTLRLSLLALLIAGASQASAYELYADDNSHLNANLEAVFGIFHSEESYAPSERDTGSAGWREGYVKYGISADQGLNGAGTVYGAFSLLSSGTWGDGDAIGFSTGDERTTKIEDAYAGWRSGNLIEALGEDGVDLSFGRQNIVIGDGFLISGDALNIGDGLGGEFNRGGAYYLAARKNFDQTAVLRLGGQQGWRGDLMHLESDNRAQAKTEMNVATLEHVADVGTVGLTYIHTTDVDENYIFSPSQPGRDGMKTYSLRATGNAGVENLFLSGEYAKQEKNQQDFDDENAWYLEAGWTFSDVAWSPNIDYRYSRFSEGYDTLFYGFSRGYGTWFQGEVAGNYAGPFNSNSTIQQLSFKVSPLENLSLGALFFDFNTDKVDPDNGLLNTDGNELDLYAEWGVNEHLMVMPLVGIYQPDKSAEQGGSQLGNDDRNVYAQVVFATMF